MNKDNNSKIADDRVARMLELRRVIKKKKPVFLRQDFQIKKLEKRWRRAKGIHSKMRRKMAGHILMPNPCFGSPKIVKGLTANGLRSILIYNVDGLAKVKEGCCAVISGNVGIKKRIEIAKKASASGIMVGNIVDVNGFIKNAEEMIKKKKDEKKSKASMKKTEEAKQAIKIEEKTAAEKTAAEHKEMKKKVLEKRA